MQGCVVLQGLEQACMDVVCTAVVGVNRWWMDLVGQEFSVEHLSLCIRRSLHGCGVHCCCWGSIVVWLEVWQKFSCKVVLCCKA